MPNLEYDNIILLDSDSDFGELENFVNQCNENGYKLVLENGDVHMKLKN